MKLFMLVAKEVIDSLIVTATIIVVVLLGIFLVRFVEYSDLPKRTL
jgi:hypothetical protein